MRLGFVCRLLFALLLFVALPGMAQAEVRLSGTFTASKDCPALQSIAHRTNPGDITVAAGQSYPLVGDNKVAATYYQLRLDSAQPQRRWVAVDCGSIQSDEVNAASSDDGTGVPVGHWLPTKPTADDQYVLALSWEPDFCVGRHNPADPKHFSQECVGETAASWDASHLALHGLWRDPFDGPHPYDICLDPQPHYAELERNHNWSEEPAVSLSPAAATHLATDMPGVQSHLEQHEWLVHGTCSGVDQETFFGRATALQDEVNASPVRDLLVPNASITLAQLRERFTQTFPGADAGNVVMTCFRGGFLEEIDIGLMGDVTGSTSLAALMARTHVPQEKYRCDTAIVGVPRP